jgi:hypothetical protein
MAIGFKKYVDISTIFPRNDSLGRGFGGLIFTTSSAIDERSTASAAISEYVDKGFAYMTEMDVQLVFGKDSLEYKAAEKYYDYMSPSGRSASRIAFAKYDGTDLVAALAKADQLPDIKGFGSVLFLDKGLPSSAGESGEEMPADLTSLLGVVEYNATTLSNKYLIVVARQFDSSNLSVYKAEALALKDYTGACYVVGADVTSGVMPMAILGALDFQNGTTTNFMFKQFDKEVPVVSSSELYDTLSESFINFYGQTQTNGQTLAFFQRGFNTDGYDTALFCNEMWFKAACEVNLMNLLTSQERIPASAQGVDMVKLSVIEVCSDAVNNASFMPKVADREALKMIRRIVEISGGDEAAVSSIAVDLETKGYSVYAYLAAPKADSTEMFIAYYVFYGTADSIRFIEGNNVLI